MGSSVRESRFLVEKRVFRCQTDALQDQMASRFDLVGDQIAEDVAHIDAALHRVLTKIRVFDDAGAWAQQGFRSCAGWLSWRVGWSGNTARDHVRVANALGALPKIDRALERAEVS